MGLLLFVVPVSAQSCLSDYDCAYDSVCNYGRCVQQYFDHSSFWNKINPQIVAGNILVGISLLLAVVFGLYFLSRKSSKNRLKVDEIDTKSLRDSHRRIERMMKKLRGKL